MGRYTVHQSDTTQKDIVAALRKVGVQVEIVGGSFDLLCHFRGRLFMLDAKTPTTKKGTYRLTKKQEALLAAGWPLICVTSPTQALDAITRVSER